MKSQSSSHGLGRWIVLAVVALAGWTAVVASLDVAGSYPGDIEGPGLTLDETFNVEQGVVLLKAIRQYGWGILHPASLREIFSDPQIYLADHPPLGRLAIGLFHNVTASLVPPNGENHEYVIACARTAPATAWALTVFLVGWYTGKWYGNAAGYVSAIAVLFMPRLFAHAHLAALESFMGLTYAASVLVLADRWSDRESIGWRSAIGAGVLLGLALLTKIQGTLLLPPIAVWTVVTFRKRATAPLLIWFGVGFLIFFIGWPWLWTDTWDHLMRYFGGSIKRGRLYVWYFGEKWADKDVPWHYPGVLFLTTIPTGFLGLGIWGLFSRFRPVSGCRRTQLVLACLVFPLLVFTVPGVTVYDGARLFLVAFPLWAVFVGRGGIALVGWLRRRLTDRVANLVLAVFLIAQGYGLVVLHPCQLSYYNLLVGGPRGAARLGLEPTYWGDSVTRSLLSDVVKLIPYGSTVDVSPVPHQFYLSDLLMQSPILEAHGVRLHPFDVLIPERSKYLLVFRRMADLPELIRQSPPDARLLAEVRRDGVQLAAFYQWFSERSSAPSRSK